MAAGMFCGAGGISYGLQKAGMRACAGLDADPTCRCPFEANIGAPFYGMAAGDVSARFPGSRHPPRSAKMLAGCTPRQPFSCRLRTGCVDRRTPPTRFADMAKSAKPDIVTMGNVPGPERHRVPERITEALDESGCRRRRRRHDAADCSLCGVPQTRRRPALPASRLGRIGPPGPVRAGRARAAASGATGRMDTIVAGGSPRRGHLHRSSPMSRTNMERIRKSKPGGTGGDREPCLRAGCRRRAAGAAHPTVYGRMSRSLPGPTTATLLIGFGGGRLGHLEQDRAPSLREGALPQAFPPRHKPVPRGEEVKIRNVGRMIGNAATVKLGRAAGACIAGELVGQVG